jgi:hypothetical protein
MLSGSPATHQVGGSSEVANAVSYVQSEVDVMEGKSSSDSDVKERCDESRLICVKEEPPDATGSASSDDEVGQEQLTCVAVKQEVPVSMMLHVYGRVGSCRDLGSNKWEAVL